MKRITNRQEKLLESIIKEYNKTLKPVGSKVIMDEYMPEISAQTIRIEMAKLEDLGLLEKTHISSGRIPSIKGYQYYDKNILVPFIDKNTSDELNFIFERNYLNFDHIIEESLNIINKVTGFLSLSNSVEIVNEKFKQINHVELSENESLLIFITHTGNIEKTIINHNKQQLEDVLIVVKVFNEYLKDVEINSINQKIKEIQPLMKNQLNDYDFIYNNVINQIFKIDAHVNEKKRIVGVSSIINNPEFQDTEKLQKIIESIEIGTIWDQIKENIERNLNSEKIAIEYKEDLPISIATADLKFGNDSHQISIIGPNKWDLREIKGILEYMTNQFEKFYDELKDNNESDEKKYPR